jgi:hypothetical protein
MKSVTRLIGGIHAFSWSIGSRRGQYGETVFRLGLLNHMMARKKVLDEQYRKYFGPEFWEQLFYWRSRDELQARRAAIRHELRDYFATGVRFRL